MTTTAIILAAGQGTRMKSELPKVMHALCGRPLIYYPIRAAIDAGCEDVVVVVGHGREHVEKFVKATFGDRVRLAVQEKQLGTGDAARAAMSSVPQAAKRALIFYGDVPLIEASDVAPVIACGEGGFGMATCTLEDPHGYGRIVRNEQGAVVGIKEHKDLSTDAECGIREMNPGIFACTVAFLRESLDSLTPNNSQGEYYLTDIIGYAVKKGMRVETTSARAEVADGVNDRAQLAAAEVKLQARIVTRWQKSGVTIRNGVAIEESVTLEPDATIESHVVLRGATKIGRGAVIDVGSVLTNVVVEAGANVKPYTVAVDSHVGARAQVGPFSHLRPESVLGEDVHIGNFVETKKTTLGKGSKANHLAYLGDGAIGSGVNIGAGTIFCNYDGFSKHVTTIEDGAFIGSDSQIVAPVTIGKDSYVATGTTVTKHVPPNALAISRVSQENKADYASRLRVRLKEQKARAQKPKEG